MRTASDLASPLADAIAQFIEHKRVLGRRYETETYALRLFDRYLVDRGVCDLGGITPELIEAFLSSRPRHRPRSFNHLVGVLHRLFDWLVAREIVARSPVCVPTRRPSSTRLPARIPFIFVPEQARRLLLLAERLVDSSEAKLRGPTYHVIFAILYGLGLRVSEACHLNVGDVDRGRRLLVIRNTKFGKDRLVPFGPRLGKILDRYLALRQACARDLPGDEPLFCVRGHRRLTRQQIGRVFRQLQPELDLQVPAGASPPRVHDLRHYPDCRIIPPWHAVSAQMRQQAVADSA